MAQTPQFPTEACRLLRSPYSSIGAHGTEPRVQKILRMADSGTTFTIRDRPRISPERFVSPTIVQAPDRRLHGEWLNEQRLRRAAHLLENSYLSVKEIATSGIWACFQLHPSI